MHIAIIGAGPAGLLTGAALHHRGHDVTIVDRDPGPSGDGSWDRRGVMQFHHAHAFRRQVVETLAEELPEALQAWLDAGAEPATVPLPDGTELTVGMRSQRITFERVVRAAVEARASASTGAVGQPSATRGTLRLVSGHVDEVTSSGGRLSGIRLGGTHLAADVAIDASGRSGRVTAHLREAPLSGGRCGIAYTDRLHQLLEGAEPGPMMGPIAYQGDHDGYQVLLFLHEHGTFSVLIIRPVSDRRLLDLRHNAAFEAACRAIPALAVWTDPSRSRPISNVYPGGALVNWYRSQRGPAGRLALPGLLFVGDSVCTTTPNFGRGMATTCLQVKQLLTLVDEHSVGAGGAFDPGTVGEALDAWNLANLKPWVDDHAHMDADQARRWEGGDVDLSRRLPTDLILQASSVDPAVAAAIPLFGAMAALPSSLDALEPQVRELYRSGWRPGYTEGPTRDELAEVVAAAVRLKA